MMDKDKLRKADIFSGGVIFLAGAFIVSQAFKMPMKDSWGGVQNVWYVSPAIFPLFVGAIIMLLGGLLVRTALKEVGIKTLINVGSFLLSSDFIRFLKLEKNLRFYAIITVLLSFVYLFIPRVDFFLSAIEFLLVFICIFHLEENTLLTKLFLFYSAQILIFILFLISGLGAYFSSYISYPGDWMVLIFILTFAVFAIRLCKGNDRLKKKIRTSLIVAVAAPVIVGVAFKYLLLVPMPFEGIVVELMDFIWYF
ncbi:MAG TPA: hypothetical protein VMW95_08210 [Desulfobacterales bacterium]|nr:hypothetical protein [Desulfobacterales bacterium]